MGKILFKFILDYAFSKFGKNERLVMGLKPDRLSLSREGFLIRGVTIDFKTGWEAASG
jgi:hypothetical protein